MTAEQKAAIYKGMRQLLFACSKSRPKMFSTYRIDGEEMICAPPTRIAVNSAAGNLAAARRGRECWRAAASEDEHYGFAMTL